MYQATIYEVDLKISTVSVGRDEEEGGGAYLNSLTYQDRITPYLWSSECYAALISNMNSCII